MIGRLIVLLSSGLSLITQSECRLASQPDANIVEEQWMWFNYEAEVMDFLLLFGSDLVHSPVELSDLSLVDASFRGVSVVKMYDARIAETPVLKAYGFNEFSVEAGLDLNMKLNVDNFTTGEVSEPAAVTLFDVRVKVKMTVTDSFRRSCATRLRPAAASFGQILLVLPGRKIVLDEKAQPPYSRNVLREAVLEYLNENFFYDLDGAISYDSYVCNR